MGGRRVRPAGRRAVAASVAAALVAVAGFGTATAAGGTAAQAPPTTIVSPSTTVPGPTIPTTIAPPTTGTTIVSPSTTTVTTPPPSMSIPTTTSTSTTAPEPPGEPEVTVTPATGVQVGDTVTVSGTGFPPGALLGLSACIEEVLGNPTGLPTAYCQLAIDFPDVDDEGSFSTEVVVASPDWEVIHALAVNPNRYATAPIDVVDPPAPEVALSVGTEGVPAGEVVYGVGHVWPHELAGDVRVLACADVPASPSDRASVEAACGPIDEAPSASTAVTGSFYASALTQEGDEALWVGARLEDGGVLGAAAPFEQLPPLPYPTLVVEPSEDLVGGQVVRVSGAGFPAGDQYYVNQCDAGILSDGISIREVIDNCADRGIGRQVFVVDGRITAEVTLQASFDTYEGRVDCTSAPGACAVVAVSSSNVLERTTAAVTISYRLPPVTVAPQAARVTEGDAGTVTAEVPVRLNRRSDEPVTVEWTTFDAPGLPWAATYGDDADAGAGTLVIPAGEVEATIAITVRGDTAAEGEEMALLGISSAEGATIGGFAGIGGVVIDDDD